MEDIREAVPRENPEWLKLRDEFQFTEELRRLVYAELIYLSRKGKIVLRAAIRLTKGFFGKAEHNKKQPPQLEFADLSHQKDGEGEKQKNWFYFLKRPMRPGFGNFRNALIFRAFTGILKV